MASSGESNSIAKAAEIMKCLTNGICRLSDIARKLSYSKSTVHRMLKNLTSVGFAIQDPNTLQYYPGPLLNRLAGNIFKSHQAMRQCVLEHIESLRDTFEETATVQIPQGGYRLMIATANAVRSYTYYAVIGDFSPLYTGAGGKMLLAEMSDEEAHRILDGTTLVSLTPKTTIDRDQIWAQIAQARRQGHFEEFGEIVEGGGSISVPIKNYICPAVVSITGYEPRLKSNQQKMLACLKETAVEISRKLAGIYRGSHVHEPHTM